MQISLFKPQPAQPVAPRSVIAPIRARRPLWRHAAQKGQGPEPAGEPTSSSQPLARPLTASSDASSRDAQVEGSGDPGGSGSDSDASSSRGRQSLWAVPWSGWEATRFVALIYAANATAPALVAAAARAVQGLAPGEMPPDEREYLSLVTQLLQLASTALLLRTATAPHRPLPRRWFCFRADSWALMSGGAGAVAALGGVVLLAAVLLEAQPDGVATLPRLAAEWRGQVAEGRSPPAVAAGALLLVALGPLTEELFYRGYLLPTLTAFMPPAAAVLASSLLFASTHPAGAFVPELLLGCVFGTALFAARGSLAAPLIAHAAYNGAVLIAALLLSGSGGSGGGGGGSAGSG